LQGAWANFRAAMEKSSPSDPGTTLTRERWLLPLFQELGYGRLITAKAVEVDGKSYPVSHGWGDAPIHLIGFRVDLDHRTAGVAGAARASPHSLLQELLNTSDAHMWGFLSNGLQLRILRDNASLTRQAYVEFDLETMMTGEVYADFALLWLMCHQSRVEAERPAECWLEKWSRAAQEQGTRALDQLRDGVEAAIIALGRGFLAHRENRALRDKLYAGELRAQDYYRQLLRQVYRLIFLFVAEDRGLLLDPKSDPAARERYTRFYSTARLRRLAERQRGRGHADLFHGLRLVIERLGSEAGCPELGLPALGGFLFSPEAAPDLAGCEIANYDLLDAIRALAFTADKHSRRAVDYRNLGPEELGSVYESLLELHPVLNTGAATFELQRAGGSERKTTGSHYSPTGLIMRLIESALDPVIEEAVKRGAGNAERIERALLDLKVCDMACGSGHFLIAAAWRIARRLAAVRSGEEEPSPENLRAALHDVIAHCIYGVDVNAMAVELCKVNLWLESLEPGKPLSFLDGRIKPGNSLIGVTPGLDTSEIPDEAFNTVAGDHKPTAGALKKRNRAERAGQLSLMDAAPHTPEDLARWAAERARKLAELPEDTAAQVSAKAGEYARYRGSPEFARRQLEADLWTAAFFWPIKAGADGAAVIAPTHGELMRLRRGESLNPELAREVKALAGRVRFFHWPLEFPEVFHPSPFQGEGPGVRVGFDCILGNPPWERIKLQEEEFFAARDPEIAAAPNKAARQKLIDALSRTNPALAQEFEQARHAAEAQSKFVRAGGRFPLTAVGDVNTYALFAELARSLVAPTGRAGIIVPTGIATDDTTKQLFGDLTGKRALASLFDFENREGLFPAVDSRMKFCLLTMSGPQGEVKQAEFAFFATRVEHLDDERRRFTLAPDEIALFNPNTRTMPVFRTRADAELTRKIYQRVPVLVNDSPLPTGDGAGVRANPWGVSFLRMFDMSNDSGLFATEPRDGYLPLYEAKMLHQFDHRWATYDGDETREVAPTEKANPRFAARPRYWVSAKEVNERLHEWKRGWLVGFRDITNATNERTAIFSLLPRVGVGHTAPLMFVDAEHLLLLPCLLANLNSLALDYIARHKIGGTHLTYNYLRQFPILPPAAYTPADIDFIAPRVLELVYTAYDLEPFARDMLNDVGSETWNRWFPQSPILQSVNPQPFRWDEDRRALLRAELDAYYAKLYGLNRDELRYILDPKDVYGPDPSTGSGQAFPGETFRVLKEKEERLYGEYRTQRLVLEAWDKLFGN
jgi:hypothetical protein